MGTRRRRLAGAGLLLFNAVALPSCASKSVPAAETAPSDLTAYVSIKELMQNMIDPIADNIFDAVGTDVTAKGIVDTKPVTDDDWAKVRQGAVTLAEGTNLLKMRRPVAPPGDTNKSIGPNAPELSPEQIQAKIDQDRALWNRHVNQLRDDALKVLAIVKAKDVDALFQAGSDIDRACETCHLEYWYPGDKKAVLEDERQHATITPLKKK
jgi:cytochrome c556